MIELPGIYQISNEDYHADPCSEPSLSKGMIHTLLNQTPAHLFAKNKRLNPRAIVDEPESKFDTGTAAHALLLEGIDKAVVCKFNDWRTKDAQKERERVREDGKIPFLPHQYDEVSAMVKAANKQLAASDLGIKDLITEGKSEESFFWQETISDYDKWHKTTETFTTWGRCRTDWRSNDSTLILDYKTTTSADPNEFIRKIVTMGYDIQESWYRRGVRKAANLEKLPKFVFMVQETAYPYLCSFISLDATFKEIGKQKVENGLFMWRKCLESGEWPAYPQQICEVECPPWAMAGWELKAAELGGL